MEQILFRTETFSGLDERNAASVMSYETFELNNTDILETILTGVFKDYPCDAKEKCTNVLQDIQKNGASTNLSLREGEAFFQEVLDEIEKATGHQIRYALWLTTMDSVTDQAFYGKYVSVADDIDCYEVGPVILSELGFEGTLYGYAERPVSLEEQAVLLQDQMIDIVNERESARLSKKRAQELDERYYVLDASLNTIRDVCNKKRDSVAANINVKGEELNEVC